MSGEPEAEPVDRGPFEVPSVVERLTQEALAREAAGLPAEDMEAPEGGDPTPVPIVPPVGHKYKLFVALKDS